MFKANENYLKLPGNYLFSTIASRIEAYGKANPDKAASIVRLGIGDVTQPLAPSIVKALHEAVDEMADAATFRGYAPDLGYDFLRETIARCDFEARGAEIHPDEVFVSDGAKSDSANIQEIFSDDARIAVCDPVYPVYVDSNVMAGRTGTYDEATGLWSDVTYMPCTSDNGFIADPPSTDADISLIYLCFPNNPTGAVISRPRLQAWVDYANEHGAVIVYDAAYEAYITDPELPHSIYECDGARSCAIEIRSFSKNAGFTGTRLGYTVVPRDLKDENGVALRDLWARRHGTKFNGAPYIVQRAGEAVYSEAGQRETREQIRYYMDNAHVILDGLTAAGFQVFGGVNAPYIWLKVPDGMSSWEFFDMLLERVQVVGTPGSGFGPSGEGYFRLTAFGSRESALEAVRRIKSL
ncbi:MAG: LL-diaminopimelate aminotransferase [Eggerthellaceae bacterium]|nr:LL-diaminopimelate aminotransferase [Eggerthellaceae bacterium]